jgi:hypothetical protein
LSAFSWGLFIPEKNNKRGRKGGGWGLRESKTRNTFSRNPLYFFPLLSLFPFKGTKKKGCIFPHYPLHTFLEKKKRKKERAPRYE